MTNQAIELTLLQDIKKGLAELGKQSNLLDKTVTNFPIHMLSVSLGQDGKGRDRMLMVSPYDTGEDKSFYNHTFLQMYVQIPINLSVEQMATVTLMLPHVNQQMAIGHYGIQYHENRMYFKYILLLAEKETDTYKKVAEIIELINFSLMMVESTMDLVENGLNFEEIQNQEEPEE